MFGKIKAWLQGFGDIIDWILRIGAASAVVGSMGFFIKQWISGIDTTQLILVLVAVFGFVLILLSIILRWLKNRSVRNIPDILYKMDEKMKCLIGTATLPEAKMSKFLDDAGELWSIDVPRIKTAFISGNYKDMKEMVREYEKNNPFQQSSPHQPFKMLSEFLNNLAGLMKTDGISIDDVKDNEYRKLEKQLEVLQKRLRDSKSVKSITAYMLWWNGGNHYWLLQHYEQGYDLSQPFIPAKVKAAIPQLEFLIKAVVKEYLGYVKDNIYGNNKPQEMTKE